METVTHKRGDTYQISIALTAEDGETPIDITEWTVKSQVRKRKTLVTELVFAAVDLANGSFTLTAEDTTEWPTGTLSSDIEYTDGDGIIRSSETYEIDVEGDITYD